MEKKGFDEIDGKRHLTFCIFGFTYLVRGPHLCMCAMHYACVRSHQRRMYMCAGYIEQTTPHNVSCRFDLN